MIAVLRSPGARRFASICAAIACAFCVPHGADAAQPDAFPSHVSQGALVIASVVPGSEVTYAGHKLRVAADGTIVFGVGRDERGQVHVDVRPPHGKPTVATIAIDPRDFPVERIDGVPPKTVEPPPDIAERIKREQARVVAARDRDDARTDFAIRYAWPVAGRISGRFGNQRVYVVNGKDVPKAPHSGMDIAVPEGTPVKAPAGGIVTFTDPDLYLTGGTLLIDHGHGVSSNFLHLSRIDVKVGDRIEQGQVIGAVGHTGRATGPHLHWGMNWFDVRLDPLLLFESDRVGGSHAARVDLRGPTAVAYYEPEGSQARIAIALESAIACAHANTLALATATVTAPVLAVREADQPDVELVRPEGSGLYLFWPGRKPGRAFAVDLDLSAPGDSAARAMADYFELPSCARS